MIVLEAIDLAGRRADFRVVEGGDETARAEFAHAAALARQLGLDDVRLHLGLPPAAGRGAGAPIVAWAAGGDGGGGVGAAAPPLAPAHYDWRHSGDGLDYELVFAHAPQSRDLMALWIPLVLVTAGPYEERLMQLHTGLYEICANILEHGRPRRSPATFTVCLRLLPDRVEGYVQDCCERFDSSRPPFQGMLQRIAARERRGFGIHMMLRLIDRLEHEYNDLGNRLTFSKRMLP